MISFLLDPNPNSNIVFECSDFRHDVGLLLKRKKDDKFELHLLNDYTNQAIAMVLSIEDFAKMFVHSKNTSRERR